MTLAVLNGDLARWGDIDAEILSEVRAVSDASGGVLPGTFMAVHGAVCWRGLYLSS